MAWGLVSPITKLNKKSPSSDKDEIFFHAFELHLTFKQPKLETLAGGWLSTYGTVLVDRKSASVWTSVDPLNLALRTQATMLQKRISSFICSVPLHIRTSLYSTQPSSLSSQLPSSADTQPPNTHYRITLYRSAIALPKRYKATLVSLGIHRRMQTVYHPHTPDIAGKILRVKELVEVQNVPASSVRTKTEQRWERRPRKGYEVVRKLKDTAW